MDTSAPPESLPKSSIDTLQAGRAFAALAVLLFHVEVTLALPQYVGREVFEVFRSGYSGVHFFFVLSGFVILLAHRKDVGRTGRVGAFAWKRFRRIYPPLWAALLVLTPATLALPLLNNDAGFGVLDVLSAFALTPATYDPVLSVIWTLRHEMLFYGVFALVLWRPKVGFAVGGAWMALSAVLPWTALVKDDWIRFFFTSQHLLFAFGAGACLLYQRGRLSRPGLLAAAGVALFLVTWMIPILKLPLNGIVGNWAFGLGAAAAIVGAALVERGRGLTVPRPLVFLGEASYAIYLVHAPAIYAATAAIVALAPQARQAGPLLFVVVALISLAAGVAFHLWVEKPLLARIGRRPGRAAAEAAAP